MTPSQSVRGRDVGQRRDGVEEKVGRCVSEVIVTADKPIKEYAISNLTVWLPLLRQAYRVIV